MARVMFEPVYKEMFPFWDKIAEEERNLIDGMGKSR